jgi:hypothetical protein
VSLSPAGKPAYERYEDPVEFMLQAGKRSFKGWFAVHFSSSYCRVCTRQSLIDNVKTDSIRRIWRRRTWEEHSCLEIRRTIAEQQAWPTGSRR